MEGRAMSPESGWPLAVAVGEALLQRGARLATAESCTGGWIAKVLTDIAGSSAWFDRGWVTYSNAAKQQDLGVTEALLASHGAVSEAVVLAMARGALERSGAEFALAVSGVAGPAGGTAAKPVGTVCTAWAWRTEAGVGARAERSQFPGDREAIRRQTVVFALEGLLGALRSAEGSKIK
jgi:nicotinamide-nucleotide amidase